MESRCLGGARFITIILLRVISDLGIRDLGNESGGHGFANAAPTASLVLKALPLTRAAGIPLLAAGGLATGSHVASVLALGASGAVLGTRFLLTPESLYTDAQRQALLDATDSSTVRTMAFDVARGTLGWPEGVDGRALRNSTVVDHENGRDERELKELFAKAQTEGDRERMLVWAGTGVGSMNSIKPAKVRYTVVVYVNFLIVNLGGRRRIAQRMCGASTYGVAVMKAARLHAWFCIASPFLASPHKFNHLHSVSPPHLQAFLWNFMHRRHSCFLGLPVNLSSAPWTAYSQPRRLFAKPWFQTYIPAPNLVKPAGKTSRRISATASPLVATYAHKVISIHQPLIFLLPTTTYTTTF